MEMKTLLFQNGYEYRWESQDDVTLEENEIQRFRKQFKQRLENIEMQNWLSGLSDNNPNTTEGNKLKTFREFKTDSDLRITYQKSQI